MKKQSLARLAWAAVFLLLTALLLGGLTQLLRDRETTLLALYSEPDDSLDLIIVGSSHVNNGYIPTMLWEHNDIAACNVYSWSQPMWTSYHYIREALKTQDVDIVVLEMYGMMYGHSYIMPQEIDRTNYASSFNIDPGFNHLALIRTAEHVGLDLRPWEDFLELPRYHTRWKQLDGRMFTYDPHAQPDPLKGYGLTFAVAPQPDPHLTAETELEPYEFAVQYLQKIVDLCRERGIRLIFTLAPYTYNAEEAAICRWIDRYAAENGIPFLDYLGADGVRAGFDWDNDFSDIGHLNYAGAVKLTRDLCDFLAGGWLQDCGLVYDREQVSDARRAALDLDAEKTRRIVACHDIMSAPDLPGYLELAKADDDYTLLLVNDGPPPAGLVPFLQARGLPCAEADTRFCAVLHAGGEDVWNSEALSFPLFGQEGDVRFVYGEAGASIELNGQAVFTAGDDAPTCLLVLYDTVLDRPLETVTVDAATGALRHREFTSDVLGLFRR